MVILERGWDTFTTQVVDKKTRPVAALFPLSLFKVAAEPRFLFLNHTHVCILDQAALGEDISVKMTFIRLFCPFNPRLNRSSYIFHQGM